MTTDILIPPVFESIFHEYRYYVYYGGRGSGKCVSPDTEIIMFDGSLKKAKDIKQNDLLMGPDSTPRKVLETHQGFDQMYKVVQNQAIDYIVNSKHLLVLKKNPSLKNDHGEIMPSGNLRRPNGRYPEYDDMTIIPVTEFSKKSERFKNNFHGYKTGLINFPNKKVSIEPYFLGIWLGDGEASCQRITTMDDEILKYCEEYANRLNLGISIYDKRQKSFTIGMIKKNNRENEIIRLLKENNLINNKHIPNDYLINDEKTRLELLAGILDTDAHIEKGCAYLTMKSYEFLKQVKFLADSLGFRTSKEIKKKYIPLNGKIFTAYSLTISGNINRIPFKIKRRIEKAVSKPNKDFLKTKLTIEPIGIGEYIGFELDGDHLFLLSDGTVMHNSHSVARYLIVQAMRHPLKILCTRELQNSIAESVHSLLQGVIQRYHLEQWFIVKNHEITCVITGSQFIFKGLAHNIESVKSTEGVDICWIEEADKVTQYSWDTLIPTIRKPGSKIIITFNPTHEDDPVYQMFVVKGQPDTAIMKVNWNDNPHFPMVLKKEMLHMKETDYEKYLHVWEGELRTISDAQIFKGKFTVKEFDSDGVENFLHGMDFGFANDPSAVVRCFIKDADLYIDREAVGYHMEIPELSILLKKTVASRHYKIWADCARPETISYLKNNEHWDVEAAEKWQGSVEDGIEYIRSFKNIYIHPSCTHTINEFKRYSFKIDKKTNEILPIPVDDYNHCVDCLRYSLNKLIKHKKTIYDDGVM